MDRHAALCLGGTPDLLKALVRAQLSSCCSRNPPSSSSSWSNKTYIRSLNGLSFSSPARPGHAFDPSLHFIDLLRLLRCHACSNRSLCPAAAVNSMAVLHCERSRSKRIPFLSQRGGRHGTFVGSSRARTSAAYITDSSCGSEASACQRWKTIRRIHLRQPDERGPRAAARLNRACTSPVVTLST